MKKGAKKPITIDEYLLTIPEGSRPALQKMRATIKSVAPEATEKIGYQMPMFYYKGPLVAFAAFKDHSSFFPMSLRVIDAHESDLRPYDRSKGTIRFPLDKPLPAALVKKLVKARIKENDSKAEARQKRRSKK